MTIDFTTKDEYIGKPITYLGRPFGNITHIEKLDTYPMIIVKTDVGLICNIEIVELAA